MIETLHLVKGAVAQKDLVPALTHFHIYDGRIQGANGTLAIDAPLPELADTSVTVPALRFIRAIDACDGDPTIKVDDHFLKISRGRFRAKLPLAPHDEYPKYDAPAHSVPLTFPLLDALRKLKPFFATDASKLWATGALLRRGAAWATNNIVIARVPLPWADRAIGIPTQAINELLRIGKDPEAFCLTENSVSFLYPDGSWLQTALLSTDAPNLEDFNPVIDNEGSPWFDDTEALLKAVETIAPFCPDPNFPEVVLSDDAVSTGEGDFSASMGLPLDTAGKYHLSPFRSVLAAADRIALAAYPKPVPWRGDGIAGLLAGLRA